MNPYAAYLAGADPLQVLAQTVERLRELTGRLGPSRCLEPLGPGKWSVREIVSHLADCELTFAYRLRQAAAQDHHVIQPFDQTVWSERYGAYDLESAMAAFEALRRWNLLFAGTLTAEDLERPVTHPERGEMRLRMILETMGGHDINHLQQIERAAG